MMSKKSLALIALMCMMMPCVQAMEESPTELILASSISTSSHHNEHDSITGDDTEELQAKLAAAREKQARILARVADCRPSQQPAASTHSATSFQTNANADADLLAANILLEQQLTEMQTKHDQERTLWLARHNELQAENNALQTHHSHAMTSNSFVGHNEPNLTATSFTEDASNHDEASATVAHAAQQRTEATNANEEDKKAQDDNQTTRAASPAESERSVQSDAVAAYGGHTNKTYTSQLDKIRRLTAKNKSLNTKKLSLENQLVCEKTNNADLQAAHDDIMAKYTALRDASTTELQQLRTKLAASRTKRKQLASTTRFIAGSALEKQLTQETNAQGAEIQRYKKEHTALIEAHRKKEAEFKVAIEKAQKKTVDLEAEIAQYNAAFATKRPQSKTKIQTDAEQKIANLTQNLAKMKAAKEELESTYQAQAEAVVKLNDTINDLNEKLKLHAQHETLRAALQKKIADLQATIESQHSNHASLELTTSIKIPELEKELEEHKELLHQAQQLSKQLNSQLAEQQQAKSTLEKRLEELRNTHESALQTHATELQNQKKSLEHDLAQQRTALETQQTESKEREAELNKKLESTNVELVNERSKLEQQNASLKALEESLKSANAENASVLAKQRTQHEKEIAQLRSTIAALEKDKAELQSNLTAEKDRSTQLQSSLAALQQSKDTLQETFNAHTAKTAEQEKAVADARTALDTQKAASAQLQEKHEKAIEAAQTAHTQKLREQAEQFSQEKIRLEQQILGLETTAKAKEDIIAANNATIKDLESKLRTFSTDTQNQLQQITELQAENKRLTEEIKKLNANKETLEEQLKQKGKPFKITAGAVVAGALAYACGVRPEGNAPKTPDATANTIDHAKYAQQINDLRQKLANVQVQAQNQAQDHNNHLDIVWAIEEQQRRDTLELQAKLASQLTDKEQTEKLARTEKELKETQETLQTMERWRANYESLFAAVSSWLRIKHPDEEQCRKLSQEINAVLDRNNKLQDQLTTANSKHYNEKTGLNATINKLNEQLKALQKELAVVSPDKIELNTKIKDLQKLLEEEKKKLQEEQFASRKEKSSLMDANDKLVCDKFTLSQELATLKTQQPQQSTQTQQAPAPNIVQSLQKSLWRWKAAFYSTATAASVGFLGALLHHYDKLPTFSMKWRPSFAWWPSRR